jgi:hypothetical protein
VSESTPNLHDTLDHLLAKYELPPPVCHSWLPEGWGAVVDNLIEDLIALGWDRCIYQVKEKFGGLCFYVGDASDEMLARIHAAEKASLQTCMTCSEPGRPQAPNGYWIQTLCDTHGPALPH